DRGTLPRIGMERAADVTGGAFGTPTGTRSAILNGAQGRMGALLRAEVRIEQGPDGSVHAVSLVKGSGNVDFDRHVLSVAPRSIATLPPPPKEGSGIHPDGMRSHWAFEGHLRLDKKLKDFRIPQDLPYLVGASALG